MSRKVLKMKSTIVKPTTGVERVVVFLNSKVDSTVSLPYFNDYYNGIIGKRRGIVGEIQTT